MLPDRLRIALERLVRFDISDRDNDFSDLRDKAVAEIKAVLDDANVSGRDPVELYALVVGDEETQADLEAEAF